MEGGWEQRRKEWREGGKEGGGEKGGGGWEGEIITVTNN